MSGFSSFFAPLFSSSSFVALNGLSPLGISLSVHCLHSPSSLSQAAFPNSPIPSLSFHLAIDFQPLTIFISSRDGPSSFPSSILLLPTLMPFCHKLVSFFFFLFFLCFFCLVFDRFSFSLFLANSPPPLPLCLSPLLYQSCSPSFSILTFGQSPQLLALLPFSIHSGFCYFYPVLDKNGRRRFEFR